ncbi:response regulator transcription factor [Terriglobus roseus]|uniref:Two-component system, OmpR family, copper resistance phosphate regulon response regulator CusR/two-component system, OmpR family, response regulator MprA n=1 Tax=Terriglobus roseus TaxID=392734 RepID=A0A1G7KQX2_9BACT|nr:response regulator transcription factor [Terriglobus roseus]SDF39575.1 two-component system, OmpR family, copper resistance phosphate regulon response regulator CusR/two-component system, OmpR family, response regulator MprA [Terriglobus roseus]
MQILVVEDRPRMARLLDRALRRDGHTVTLAFDGEQAMEYGRSPHLDVILLDVALPGIDGFTVLNTLRTERLTTPTIMLTARDSMEDIVRGLDLGADDYLTKPFSLANLLARIRAVSRRRPVIQTERLEFRDLALDRSTHQLCRLGRSMPLSRIEFALMEKLLRNAGMVVTKDVLVEAAWGLGADVSDTSLYVYMRALRNKIASDGERQLLHTIRGVGYTLRQAQV